MELSDLREEVEEDGVEGPMEGEEEPLTEEEEEVVRRLLESWVMMRSRSFRAGPTQEGATGRGMEGEDETGEEEDEDEDKDEDGDDDVDVEEKDADDCSVLLPLPLENWEPETGTGDTTEGEEEEDGSELLCCTGLQKSLPFFPLARYTRRGLPSAVPFIAAAAAAFMSASAAGSGLVRTSSNGPPTMSGSTKNATLSTCAQSLSR